MENKTCNCGINDNLVITCSGVADVGYISDQIARKLSRNKKRKMSCLALFATCPEEKIDEFKTRSILVIDGCNEDCGKKVMKQRGISDYNYLRITDLGFEKGKTPITQEIIQKIHQKLCDD
jgi:uncharacterized metal-binding protein